MARLTLFLLLFIFNNICFANLITPFINEIHYDNASDDNNEFIELAGQQTFDLTGWTLWLYNGSNNQHYKKIDLTGFNFNNETNDIGFLAIFIEGIQNGSPDGIALSNNKDQIVQFLSYEGVITAENGAAEGLTSIDIGVSENSNTPSGTSIQLEGVGLNYSDFSWQTGIKATAGAINQQQFLSSSIPEPTSYLLWFACLLIPILLRIK